MRRAFAAILLAVAIPAAAAPDPPPSDPESIVAAAEHYGALLQGGDPAAIAAAYAPDGDLVLPGQPVLHGRAAITAFLAPLISRTKVLSVDMHVESVEIGDMMVAHAKGRYHQSAAADGAGPQDYTGHFTGDWTKSGSGWLIARLTMQPD